VAGPVTAAAIPCRLCGQGARVRYEGVRDWFFESPGAFTYAACADPKCGALQIVPLPDADTLRAAYADYDTHGPGRPLRLDRAMARVWRLGLRGPAGLRPVARFRKTYGLIPPGARDVLDLGCGAGESLTVLAALGVAHPVGVEPDPDARREAQRHGRDVRAGDADALPVGDASMDAVLLHHVVEHVRRPAAAFAEAARVLRPGGVLVLATPNVESAAHERWGMHWRGLEAPRHLHLFSGAALTGLLNAAGFVVERVETNTLSGAWIARTSRNAAAGRTGAVARRSTAWERIAAALRIGAGPTGDRSGDELVVVATRP